MELIKCLYSFTFLMKGQKNGVQIEKKKAQGLKRAQKG